MRLLNSYVHFLCMADNVSQANLFGSSQALLVSMLFVCRWVVYKYS